MEGLRPRTSIRQAGSTFKAVCWRGRDHRQSMPKIPKPSDRRLPERRAGGPNAALARLLDTPHLERVVPHLGADVLHGLIRDHGLEACAAVIAAATPQQVSSILDVDLWHATPGRDEAVRRAAVRRLARNAQRRRRRHGRADCRRHRPHGRDRRPLAVRACLRQGRARADRIRRRCRRAARTADSSARWVATSSARKPRTPGTRSRACCSRWSTRGPTSSTRSCRGAGGSPTRRPSATSSTS